MQDLDGTNLDAAMAQHLLVAADRFALPRLRRICERRLCETVEVSFLSLLYCSTCWLNFLTTTGAFFSINSCRGLLITKIIFRQSSVLTVALLMPLLRP